MNCAGTALSAAQGRVVARRRPGAEAGQQANPAADLTPSSWKRQLAVRGQSRGLLDARLT